MYCFLNYRAGVELTGLVTFFFTVMLIKSRLYNVGMKIIASPKLVSRVGNNELTCLHTSTRIRGKNKNILIY